MFLKANKRLTPGGGDAEGVQSLLEGAGELQESGGVSVEGQQASSRGAFFLAGGGCWRWSAFEVVLFHFSGDWQRERGELPLPL